MAKSTKDKIENKKIPVVTILGHVDHGKTSILDALMGTSITEKEFGGITQHIRAHSFSYKNRNVTFVDTPGHEVFTEMRNRGGNVADVGILVVAADDGVQPQTKEAIQILKKEEIPFVVAINKIDKEGADIEKVKRELSAEDVILESYGGKIPSVEISAKEKKNLDELMEVVFLLADVNQKEAEASEFGRATVIESQKDKGLGNSALVVVREGVFKPGQLLATVEGISKLRALLDGNKKQRETLASGEAGILTGLSDILPVGEQVFSVNTKQEAEKIITLFKQELEEVKASEAVSEFSEEDIASLFSQNKEMKNSKVLPLVLKADTKGTLEAITSSLDELNDEEVQVKIIESSVGNISEADVDLANTTKAIIVGFNVVADPGAYIKAKDKSVFIKTYKVIYELIDEIAETLDSLAKPEKSQKILGKGRVIAKFVLTNGTIIAGTMVEEGEFKKNKNCYVLRGGKQVAEGQIISMRHQKDEVSEIKKGLEVGLNIKPQFDFEEGDIIVCYVME